MTPQQRWQKSNPKRWKEINHANATSWRKRNPERFAEIMRKSKLKKYGLTLEGYEAMLDQQAGRCGICDKPFERNPCIDHCHRTKKVRGLLCRHCNLVLVHAHEDRVVLENAIQYLHGTDRYARQ